MQISNQCVTRLLNWFDHCQKTVYPEPPSEMMDQIAVSALEWVAGHDCWPEIRDVLDVGCGRGTALK